MNANIKPCDPLKVDISVFLLCDAPYTTNGEACIDAGSWLAKADSAEARRLAIVISEAARNGVSNAILKDAFLHLTEAIVVASLNSKAARLFGMINAGYPQDEIDIVANELVGEGGSVSPEILAVVTTAMAASRLQTDGIDAMSAFNTTAILIGTLALVAKDGTEKLLKECSDLIYGLVFQTG